MERGKEKGNWHLVVDETEVASLSPATTTLDNKYTNDDYFKCENRMFTVTRANWNGTWNNPITSIKFKFGGNCNGKLGREECEIKIADGVGLKEEGSSL